MPAEPVWSQCSQINFVSRLPSAGQLFDTVGDGLKVAANVGQPKPGSVGQEMRLKQVGELLFDVLARRGAAGSP